MLASKEDAFICDMAETYRIYNIEEYPVDYIATLLTGLREDSRTAMSLAGTDMTLSQTVEVLTYDVLRLILWSKTKDGQNGVNRPEKLIDILRNKKKPEKVVGFDSGEEMLAAFNRIARE